MGGRYFINFDHVECKIFAFKMKKSIFLHLAILDSLTLNLPNLKILHY